ncbi:MAG: hypothetical protein M3228_08030 [Actinomycetota bacterium]|nr:hypothetical protein [Actinomycetota bacterium]
MLSGPVEPMLVEHLAHVAMRRMPYRELRRLGLPCRDGANRSRRATVPERTAQTPGLVAWVARR